jgi:hypothetical protein
MIPKSNPTNGFQELKQGDSTPITNIRNTKIPRHLQQADSAKMMPTSNPTNGIRRDFLGFIRAVIHTEIHQLKNPLESSAHVNPLDWAYESKEVIFYTPTSSRGIPGDTPATAFKCNAAKHKSVQEKRTSDSNIAISVF